MGKATGSKSTSTKGSKSGKEKSVERSAPKETEKVAAPTSPYRKLFDSYKQKLVDVKNRHVDALRKLSGELVADSSGDVADQARALQEETMSLARRGKIMEEIREIDLALDRIKKQTFGICEETGNPIEEKRLNAIPWTRLSLEGAEIREMEAEEDEGPAPTTASQKDS